MARTSERERATRAERGFGVPASETCWGVRRGEAPRMKEDVFIDLIAESAK